MVTAFNIWNTSGAVSTPRVRMDASRIAVRTANGVGRNTVLAPVDVAAPALREKSPTGR